jgi:hypothetical protein
MAGRLISCGCGTHAIHPSPLEKTRVRDTDTPTIAMPLVVQGPWTLQARMEAIDKACRQSFERYFTKAMKVRNWVPNELPIKEMHQRGPSCRFRVRMDTAQRRPADISVASAVDATLQVHHLFPIRIHCRSREANRHRHHHLDGRCGISNGGLSPLKTGHPPVARMGTTHGVAAPWVVKRDVPTPS